MKHLIIIGVLFTKAFASILIAVTLLTTPLAYAGVLDSEATGRVTEREARANRELGERYREASEQRDRERAEQEKAKQGGTTENKPKDTPTQITQAIDCIKCGVGPLVVAGEIISGATAGPVGASLTVPLVIDALRDAVKDCQDCQEHLRKK